MNHLILLRHGQSQWNLENRFTGWFDVDLTAQGEAEARKAGHLIKEIHLDRVFTSTLTRARRTAQLALAEAEAAGADVADVKSGGDWKLIEHDALRERDYGDLVGLNKAETAEKYGDEQVHLWRRGFEIKPPGGESLADVVERVRPYFEGEIWPPVAAGENVLVAAHGNSLRAVLVIIGEYDAEDIPNIELPTGKPLVFDIEGGEKQRHYYLEE
ncbi:MAG: 2,3-bisphosphoglycerate-dependent phosphoglycerate mutase [Alphaproteobacteria bacterium]|nr:2,3-bisphosphoglycerate-dependent phosphoglycerate mutase [Alphaproteobacteria bacterium]